MTITPTALLSLPIITTGTESGTWGDVVDNGLTSYLDIAIAGGLAISITGTGTVVTLANTAGTSASTGITSTTAQYAILNISGAKTGACTLNLPVTSKWYIIHNAGTGGFALTVRGVTPTTGVTLVDGEECIVAWNGTDYVKVASSVLTALTGVLPLANGGTNATSAPAAMASLMGFTTTATAAGTTTLTNTSSSYQQFTGATTQTVTLPVTSTLVTGWTFHIVNNSTGNVTVNSSGANAVITVIPGTTAMCTCVLASGTTAASWEAGLTDFSTATGTGAVVLGTTPTLNTPALAGETFSTTATVTAGTNAQGQGALTSDYNVVTTAAANPSGVTLPSATVGRRIIVVNKGANPVNVYPATSDIIDALAVNISIPLPVGGVMEFNASSVSQWYSTYNLYTTSDGYATTATAAGTTTLTSTSGYKQYFTGTTTQTVVLPVVTTLSLGRSYEIVNNSTGVLTVNSSGAALISTIPAGMSAVVTCILITGTTAASWHFEYTSYDAITGTGASVFATSPTITGNDTTIEGLVVGLGGGAVVSNTAYGVTALQNNQPISGSYSQDNTAIGYQALQVNDYGWSNTAVGAYSLKRNTIGTTNTALGESSLAYSTEGNANTAVGFYAMRFNTTGGSNVAIGSVALRDSVTGDSNVAVGNLALFSSNGVSGNTAVGSQTLRDSTTGAENAAVGYNALMLNSTGVRNTALGYDTLTAITIGGDCTALGAYALTAATGGFNTAVGSTALTNTVGGLYNTAVGANALYTNSGGNYNAAFGQGALYSVTGNNNIGIGTSAGGGITTGNYNVIIGQYQGSAAPISATGSNWIVLSDGAGTLKQIIDPTGNVQTVAGADVVYAPAPASLAAAATLTNANLQARIIQATGTTYTLTLPLGTTLETLIGWAGVDLGYEFTIINQASGTVSIAANTGVTIIGSVNTTTGTSSNYRIRRTAANTFIAYRV